MIEPFLSLTRTCSQSIRRAPRFLDIRAASKASDSKTMGRKNRSRSEVYWDYCVEFEREPCSASLISRREVLDEEGMYP